MLLRVENIEISYFQVVNELLAYLLEESFAPSYSLPQEKSWFCALLAFYMKFSILNPRGCRKLYKKKMTISNGS